MFGAIIFITTEPGKGEEVAAAISQLSGVNVCVGATNPVEGTFDAIAYTEHQDKGEIATVVVERIHRVPGVKKTVTGYVKGLGYGGEQE